MYKCTEGTDSTTEMLFFATRISFDAFQIPDNYYYVIVNNKKIQLHEKGKKIFHLSDVYHLTH